jgi:hypothetical protein
VPRTNLKRGWWEEWVLVHCRVMGSNACTYAGWNYEETSGVPDWTFGHGDPRGHLLDFGVCDPALVFHSHRSILDYPIP